MTIFNQIVIWFIKISLTVFHGFQTYLEQLALNLVNTEVFPSHALWQEKYIFVFIFF